MVNHQGAKDAQIFVFLSAFVVMSRRLGRQAGGGREARGKKTNYRKNVNNGFCADEEELKGLRSGVGEEGLEPPTSRM
jgi:hypothetical protein